MGDKWEWASDEKPPKAAGLAMIRMVLAINKEHFNINGVKLPFLIRSSDVASYDTTTRTFSAIRTNVAVDDAIFKEPVVPRF